MPVVDASLLDGGAAGAADAFAAAVGQLVACIEARLQDGLSVGNFETMAARLERDAVSHSRALITPRKTLLRRRDRAKRSGWPFSQTVERVFHTVRLLGEFRRQAHRLRHPVAEDQRALRDSAPQRRSA